jgi:hypothetical protein
MSSDRETTDDSPGPLLTLQERLLAGARAWRRAAEPVPEVATGPRSALLPNAEGYVRRLPAQRRRAEPLRFLGTVDLESQVPNLLLRGRVELDDAPVRDGGPDGAFAHIGRMARGRPPAPPE